MTPQKKTKMDWEGEQLTQLKAGYLADAITSRRCLRQPVDPFEIAADEVPFLRIGGRDFGDRFDGKLRYDSRKRRFGLMYNTKYDVRMPPGEHHPRTRFSVAHELGHYFIEHHHAYYAHGGKTHASINEFRSKTTIEREADAFAASLLLPSHLVSPILNKQQLSIEKIQEVAGDFNTSMVSTMIRGVQLSHFHCAVAGIREGAVAWLFPSNALKDSKIYRRSGHLPEGAYQPWFEFNMGNGTQSQREGHAADWFSIYDERFEDQYVTEAYFPVGKLGTLLVLLTFDEQAMFSDTDDDYGEDRFRDGY
jgi:Zn-dependent peptidase ImmA (M78 family)